MSKRERDAEHAKAATDKATAEDAEMAKLREKTKEAWAASEASTSGAMQAHEAAQVEASEARASAAKTIHEDMMAARKAAMDAAAARGTKDGTGSKDGKDNRKPGS